MPEGPIKLADGTDVVNDPCSPDFKWHVIDQDGVHWQALIEDDGAAKPAPGTLVEWMPWRGTGPCPSCMSPEELQAIAKQD